MNEKDCTNCANWKAKEPEGPFKAESVKDTWYVNGYFLGRATWIYEGLSEYRARHIAAFLNEQWKRKDCANWKVKEPEGPFIVCEGTRESWTIRYLPHNSHIVTVWSMNEATMATHALNSVWARRGEGNDEAHM